MKATIVKPVSNGKNFSDDKETISSINVVAMVKGELKTVVTCRCYMGRSSSASVVYASLWVHNGDIYTAGHGQAGGYGYHKTSAAIGSAITSAGIELWGSPYSHPVNGETQEQYKKLERTMRAYIGGCGDSSVESALIAIAKAAGARGKLLIVRN